MLNLATNAAAAMNARGAFTLRTTLRSPTFYTEASGGTVYADWVANMLAPGKRAQRHWVSEDCPTCLMQLPCP